MTVETTLVERVNLFEEYITLNRPLEEFALFNPTLDEINASIQRDSQKLLIPEVVQENMLTVAEEARIARSLCQQISIETDSYTWLKERGFEAVQIAEGSEIPSRKGSYEKYTLVVGKTAVRPLITNEMIEDSKWDVVRRNLDMATKAMARLEDRIAMNAMLQGVPNGTAVTNGVGGIGENVSNHYIQMGDQPTGGVLTWKAIALALALLRLEHYTPDTLLIHPYQMVDLMTGEGDFIGASERVYMTLPDHIKSSMATGGVIGTIGGMRVVVSSEMTAGYALMFDSSEYMIFAERRPLSVENYDDILRDMQGIVMTQRFACGPINRDAAVLLTGGRDSLFP